MGGWLIPEKKSEWRGPSRGPFEPAPDSSTSFFDRENRFEPRFFGLDSISCREREREKKRTEEIGGRIRVSFLNVGRSSREEKWWRKIERSLMGEDV